MPSKREVTIVETHEAPFSPEVDARDFRLVSSLILLPDNPRHGDIGAISQSLERFGQQKPIVINPDGVILAGNHTFQAAVALGWTDIWVYESPLEGIDQPGFALADNRLSDLATYDHDALLRYLKEQPDLTGTGYDLDDMEEVRQQIAFEQSDGSLREADERYTPRWIFEAMAVKFDVDLAAPPGGLSYIPAAQSFSKEQDALAQDWKGLAAWCNPPFSIANDFGYKWLAEITEGVWLGPLSHSRYRHDLMLAARLTWIPIEIGFTFQDDVTGIAFPLYLSGFGDLGFEALTNLHAASTKDGVSDGLLFTVA